MSAKQSGLRGVSRNIETSRRLDQSQCHTIGAYTTGYIIKTNPFIFEENMVCHYPIAHTEARFPLLSFAHGAGGGGLMMYAYSKMLAQLASSGFVVCAYTSCPFMCPQLWPWPQVEVITTARELMMPSVPEIPEIPSVPEIPEIDITIPATPTNITIPATLINISAESLSYCHLPFALLLFALDEIIPSQINETMH